MLKKAFSDEKDIKKFKRKYSSNTLRVQVTSNVLQPSYKEKYPEITNYCNFWQPSNDLDYDLVSGLQWLILHYQETALKEEFGECDYVFKGKRKYENYIFDYEGIIIIATTRREFVISEDEQLITKLVKFENIYCQFVINYILKNLDKLNDSEKREWNLLKEAGVIDENNRINFAYHLK
jgi:hypothetical protein